MRKEIPIQDAKKYIYSFDLSGIVEKLVYSEGWLLSDALETSKLYRNFLFLLKNYGSLSPSQDVDEFWHHHILNTQHYTESCLKIYGEYQHHFVHHKKDSKGKYQFNESQMLSFEDTQKLHYKEFNEYIYATKSRYPKIIYAIMKKVGTK